MKTYRIAALFLALVMAGSTLLSCGGNEPDETDAGKDTAAVAETEPAETDPRRDAKDGLPEGLQYDGRSFNIYCGIIKENDLYFEGLGETNGEIVNDAVYARNMAVEERLNIDMTSWGYDDAYNTIAGSVTTLVLAGDSSYDLFLGQQAGVTQIITENCFVNAHDIENIDFSNPWWNNNYMSELELGESYRYLLAGDYFISALTKERVIFFNKDVYSEFYGDPNELYEEVLAGNWTIDRKKELIEGAFVDMNNDGITDKGDRLGFAAYLAMASVDGYVYGAEIPFYTRDENGFVQLNMISDKAVSLAEKLNEMFYAQGSCIKTDGENVAIFKEGRALFLGNGMFNLIIDLRDMEQDYGFLPHPKYDESQAEYRTLVHDTALLGGISVASQNLDMMGAVLEVLGVESYRTVTPAWYETALKVKYTRDDISAQIIDLINETATTNFIYAYNFAINGLGNVYRDLVTAGSSDYVSTVEKKLSAGETKLNAIIEAFRSKQG